MRRSRIQKKVSLITRVTSLKNSEAKTLSFPVKKLKFLCMSLSLCVVSLPACSGLGSESLLGPASTLSDQEVDLVYGDKSGNRRPHATPSR